LHTDFCRLKVMWLLCFLCISA